MADANKLDRTGLFATWPDTDLSWATLIFDQVIGTALLMFVIMAVIDKRNNISTSVAPLYIGLGLGAVHISMAYNAGCAVNPARDFSPYEIISLSLCCQNSDCYSFALKIPFSSFFGTFYYGPRSYFTQLKQELSRSRICKYLQPIPIERPFTFYCDIS
jgi:hypothetical protein